MIWGKGGSLTILEGNSGESLTVHNGSQDASGEGVEGGPEGVLTSQVHLRPALDICIH